MAEAEAAAAEAGAAAAAAAGAAVSQRLSTCSKQLAKRMQRHIDDDHSGYDNDDESAPDGWLGVPRGWLELAMLIVLWVAGCRLE